MYIGYEKFVFRFGDTVVAVKYNTMTNQVIVGGNKKFRWFMENIIRDFFQLKNTRSFSFTQSNKIRYTFKVKSYQSVREALARAKKEDVLVFRVEKLERIMR